MADRAVAPSADGRGCRLRRGAVSCEAQIGKRCGARQMGPAHRKYLLTDVADHEISGQGAGRPGSAKRSILLAPNPIDECRNK
jgi:hypothetical protein